MGLPLQGWFLFVSLLYAFAVGGLGGPILAVLFMAWRDGPLKLPSKPLGTDGHVMWLTGNICSAAVVVALQIYRVVESTRRRDAQREIPVVSFKNLDFGLQQKTFIVAVLPAFVVWLFSFLLPH